jgi:hypothetical protein
MLSVVHCITCDLLSKTFVHCTDQEEGAAIRGHNPDSTARFTFKDAPGLLLIVTSQFKPQ